MIKIYGSPRTSAGRCFWCLEEVGASYDKVDVDMRGGAHKAPDYLALNPNGKVPVLVDGDYKLWESIAINNYLAQEYKPELLGANNKDRGHIEQWSVWSMVEFQPPMIDIFIQTVFMPEEKRDDQVIKRAQEKLPELLAILDNALKGRDYLVGNEFSLADLNTTSVAMICRAINFDISKYQEIGRWMGGIMQRPAFKKYMEMRS